MLVNRMLWQFFLHFQEQYWERAVLDIDPSTILLPGNLGEIRLKLDQTWPNSSWVENCSSDNYEIRMDLAFWLLLSWMVVLVCLAKGIRTSGKVFNSPQNSPPISMLYL